MSAPSNPFDGFDVFGSPPAAAGASPTHQQQQPMQHQPPMQQHPPMQHQPQQQMQQQQMPPNQGPFASYGYPPAVPPQQQPPPPPHQQPPMPPMQQPPMPMHQPPPPATSVDPFATYSPHPPAQPSYPPQGMHQPPAQPPMPIQPPTQALVPAPSAGHQYGNLGLAVDPFASAPPVSPYAASAPPVYHQPPQMQGMPQQQQQPNLGMSMPNQAQAHQQQPPQMPNQSDPFGMQMVPAVQPAASPWGIQNQPPPPANNALVVAPPSDDIFGVFGGGGGAPGQPQQQQYAQQPPQYGQQPPQQPPQQQEPGFDEFNFDETETLQSEDKEGLDMVDVDIDDEGEVVRSDTGAGEGGCRDDDYGGGTDGIGRGGTRGPTAYRGHANERTNERSCVDPNANIAPPPPMTPGRKGSEYLSRRDAPAAKNNLASPLPDPKLVVHSGYALSRISFRTILMRKWKQTFWIQYGKTQMLFFRTFADYEDWLNNPYHTQSARDFLVKMRVDFVRDMERGSVMGYQVTQIRRKPYGKNVMLHFKLERWMDYGPTIAAAFAANQGDTRDPRHKGSSTSNDVGSLRKIILGCMKNARDAAISRAGQVAVGGNEHNGQRRAPREGGAAVSPSNSREYRGRYEEGNGNQPRNNHGQQNGGGRRGGGGPPGVESSGRRRTASAEGNNEFPEVISPANSMHGRGHEGGNRRRVATADGHGETMDAAGAYGGGGGYQQPPPQQNNNTGGGGAVIDLLG